MGGCSSSEKESDVTGSSVDSKSKAKDGGESSKTFSHQFTFFLFQSFTKLSEKKNNGNVLGVVH